MSEREKNGKAPTKNTTEAIAGVALACFFAPHLALLFPGARQILTAFWPAGTMRDARL